MRFVKKFAAVAMAGGVALSMASAAQAVTYDLVADFGSGPFTFGAGSVGAGFALSPDYSTTGCGNAALSCYYNQNGAYGFPIAAKNGSASTLTYYTNVIATDELFLQSLVGSQSVVRFTAPTTGFYKFTGSFERLDSSNGAGDGTTVGIYNGNTSIFSAALPTTFHAAAAISQGLSLTAGSTVDFFVDSNAGSTYNDGTGLRLSASVPEAATWGMMVVGFGLLGASMRRRRTVVSFG